MSVTVPGTTEDFGEWKLDLFSRQWLRIRLEWDSFTFCAFSKIRRGCISRATLSFCDYKFNGLGLLSADSLVCCLRVNYSAPPFFAFLLRSSCRCCASREDRPWSALIFAESQQQVSWEAQVPLAREYFHAVHLVATLPPYKDVNVSKEITIYLIVKNKNKTSEPYELKYVPRPGNRGLRKWLLFMADWWSGVQRGKKQLGYRSLHPPHLPVLP